MLVALPGDEYFIVRVPGSEAGGEAGVLLLGGLLCASPQQASDPIERVVLPAPVRKRRRLDAATNRVDGAGAELDDVEGVEDGDRVGQLVADRVRTSNPGDPDPSRRQRRSSTLNDEEPLMLACSGRVPATVREFADEFAAHWADERVISRAAAVAIWLAIRISEAADRADALDRPARYFAQVTIRGTDIAFRSLAGTWWAIPGWMPQDSIGRGSRSWP